MSSSLLLGCYVIQAQQKQETTHIQHVTRPISPVNYNNYNEHEHNFFEETSKYLSSISPTSQSKLKKCECCPYGFHIDLDFIRYCEELAANGKSPSSKQIDRRNKRRQRKSMEVMLGFEEQWILNYENDLQASKHKPHFQTLYEVSANSLIVLQVQKKHCLQIFDGSNQKSLSPYDNVEYENNLDKASTREHIVSSQDIANSKNQGDFVNSTLYDVYSDFERTLERTSTRGRKASNESKYKNEIHSIKYMKTLCIRSGP